MASRQTLSEPERRLLAGWAAVCAARVLPLYSPSSAGDRRIPEALDRARAFAEGRSTAGEEIGLRMVAVKAAGEATTKAGAAAGRAVAQAASVAHMGAHALGAAAYAVKARTLAEPASTTAQEEEAWQLEQLTADQRRALRLLPPLGSDPSGPLGPGLLTTGVLGDVIGRIQAAVAQE